MKKLLYLILILICLFQFASCDLMKTEVKETTNSTTLPLTTVKENSEEAIDILISHLNSFGSTRYNSTVLYNENNYYFCNEIGVFSINKTDGRIKELYKSEDTRSMQIANNRLYFVMSEGYELSSIKLDGSDIRTEITKNDYPYKENVIAITDYQVVNETIFVGGPSICFSFNTKTKHYEELVGAQGVGVFQVFKDHLYYTEHATKNGTIFDLNLKTKERNILFGKGEMQPKEFQYYNFSFLNDALFYCQSTPTGFYIRDKESDKIIHGTHISDIKICNDKIFYVTSHTISSSLYSYDLEKQKEIFITELPQYDIYSGFCIINDIVIFKSGFEIEMLDNGRTREDYTKSKIVYKKISL